MAFPIVNYWISMFETVAHRRLSTKTGVVSNQTKVNFTGHISRLKRHYNLTDDEIKAGIYFSYKHNPLHFDDLADYGKLASLERSLPYFKFWMSKHKDEIAEKGMIQAITDTVPKAIKIDKELFSLMDELEEVFNESK